MKRRQRELTAEEYAVLASCPQFSTCTCQDCPLDARNDIRVFWPGEEICTARKSTRLRLGSSLPRKGLTRREFAQATRYHGSVEAYINAREAKKAKRDKERGLS